MTENKRIYVPDVSWNVKMYAQPREKVMQKHDGDYKENLKKTLRDIVEKPDQTGEKRRENSKDIAQIILKKTV